MGTWIEIFAKSLNVFTNQVVSYVGTWIEMSYVTVRPPDEPPVVPYVGTWIEIDRTSLWTVPLIIFVVCYKGDKLKNSEGHYRSFLLSDKKQ